MRMAGRPMTTAVDARPAAMPMKQRDEEVDVVVGDQPAGHRGADADQAELAEADLAGPAGQHDQR